SGALPTSRMCVRCKFFDPFRYENSATPHYCHLAQMPFAEGQLRIDCAVFEAGDAAEQAALWQRFASKRLERAAAEEATETDATTDATDPTHAAQAHSGCEMAPATPNELE